MIKKYLINLAVSGLFIFVLVQILSNYNNLVQDTTFIVGVVMTSFGLLTATGASKMFRGMGFVIKRMFTKKVDGMSFYDYLLTKQDKSERVMGYPLLFSGITLIILSLAIADNLEVIKHIF